MEKEGGFTISACAVEDRTIDENQMEGEHLVVSCTLSTGPNTLDTHAMLDTGCTAISFIDESFARDHNLPLHALRIPRTVEVIDGRAIESGMVTHLAEFKMDIGGHSEKLLAFVTRLGHYPLVLGIPWLRLHDVAVRFSTGRLTFDSDYCLGHCTRRVTTTDAIQPPDTPPESEPPLSSNKIHMINAAALMTLAKTKTRHRSFIFSASLNDINKALGYKDIEKKELKSMIPEEYHEFLDLFDRTKAQGLPPHCPYDHKINLKPGFDPPFGPLYPMSRKELEILKGWLEEHLPKNFI
jgi:predicted aspartyl protease